MARGDRDKQRLRRAHEILERGLKRADIELAFAGMNAVPADERGAFIDAVARLWRNAVDELFAHRQWRALCELDGKRTRLPEIARADGADDDRVAWALCWAAIHLGRLDDATRALESLQPRLPHELAASMSALVRGVPLDHAALASLGIADGDLDRLGYDDAPRRDTVPVPQAPDEVPAALFALAARSIGSWAPIVRGWLPAADLAVRSEVQRLAGDLALRELMLRVRGNEGQLAEPATLLADLAGAGRVEGEAGLAPVCAVALRVVAARVTGDVADRDLAQALLTLATAAAAAPDQLMFAVCVIEDVRFATDLAPVVLPALEALLGRAPRVALWLKAAEHWVARGAPSRGASPPPWLAAAFERLLDGEAFAGLGARAGTIELRRRTLMLAAAVLPAPLCERAFEAAWAAGDAEIRAYLASAFRSLLARVTEESLAPPGGWKSVPQREMFRDMAALLGSGADFDEMLDMLDEGRSLGLSDRQADEVFDLVSHPPELPAPARALWERWRARLLPLHPSFLELALEDAETPDQALAAAHGHLADRADVAAWFSTLATVGKTAPRFEDAVLQAMLKRFEHDVPALAQAVVLAKLAPLVIRRAIAEAFLAAHRDDGVSSAVISNAVRIANALKVKPRKRSAPAKKKPRSRKLNQDLPF